MKLFYAPGSCAMGIHLLLEEIGKPYEAELVNLKEGAQYQPAYMAVNPKSKVPALLRDDGTLLTEFQTIAYWLARSNPFADLLPDDIELQARALEIMDYIVATVHMQGFTRIFRPGAFTPSAQDEEAVKARGLEIFSKGLAMLDKGLEGKEYAVGKFSIADAALFYVELWAGRINLELPPNLKAHFARMMARPAAQRMLKAEGLA